MAIGAEGGRVDSLAELCFLIGHTSVAISLEHSAALAKRDTRTADEIRAQVFRIELC